MLGGSNEEHKSSNDKTKNLTTFLRPLRVIK